MATMEGSESRSDMEAQNVSNDVVDSPQSATNFVGDGEFFVTEEEVWALLLGAEPPTAVPSVSHEMVVDNSDDVLNISSSLED